MRARHTSAFLLCAALCAVACTDNREPVTTQSLREQVESDSGGALTLASMTKTNGYDFEREGMKLYSLEWNATIQVNTNGWKAGWQDYRVLPHRPNALQAAVEGASVKRLLMGATAVIQGKSTLQNADRGWRVLDSQVTAVRIVPPPDNPSEGRSTDIQRFFAAFKQAVASRDRGQLAKFVRFPLRKMFSGTLSEAEFEAHLPLNDDDIKAIALANAPISRDNGTYFLQTGMATGIGFQRDDDGYWKWTSVEFMGD